MTVIALSHLLEDEEDQKVHIFSPVAKCVLEPFTTSGLLYNYTFKKFFM